MPGALLIPLALSFVALTNPGAHPGSASARPSTVVAAPVLGTPVTIEAHDDEHFPSSYDVADRLAPATVLRIRATGFEPFVEGFAQQCGSGTTTRCGNLIPVQFDADGEARFQYLVTDRFVRGEVPGRCRSGAAPCTIVVADVHGRRRGEIQSVFGGPVAPPGRITVRPATDLSLAGQTVTVRVREFPPGTRLRATVCAAPDAFGRRCGRPGPSAPLVVGSDGTGRTDLRIEPGPVGRELASCERGDECGVSVASDAVFARAPVVPISFAAPPGAAYDPTRLVVGLALAALLLLVGCGLIWRTDWSAVGEAAAPEIDDAEYADLDAIIAALPPEVEVPA